MTHLGGIYIFHKVREALLRIRQPWEDQTWKSFRQLIKWRLSLRQQRDWLWYRFYQSHQYLEKIGIFHSSRTIKKYCQNFGPSLSAILETKSKNVARMYRFCMARMCGFCMARISGFCMARMYGFCMARMCSFCMARMCGFSRKTRLVMNPRFGFYFQDLSICPLYGLSAETWWITFAWVV